MDKDQNTTQGAVSDSAATLADPQIEALAKTLGVPPLPGQSAGPGASIDPGTKPKADFTEGEVAEALTILADFMYARTGADHWIVTAREKEMLGKRGKAAFDLFVNINPAWLVAVSLVSGIGVVYVPRFAADAQAKKIKDQKTESKKEERDA